MTVHESKTKYRCVIWYAGGHKGVASQFGYDLELDAYAHAASSTVEHCFQAAGVRFARTVKDVAFYFRALKRDDADHPSIYVDKRARLE